MGTKKEIDTVNVDFFVRRFHTVQLTFDPHVYVKFTLIRRYEKAQHSIKSMARLADDHWG